MTRIGLIVNPVAGLGGRVGLKGSDGVDIQRRALDMGAVPQAIDRGAQALRVLHILQNDLELLTWPGEMGEDSAQQAGIKRVVLGSIQPGKTGSKDTIKAAQTLADQGCGLILFAGGDGTARDIYSAVGTTVPVLGIPAGVKIHSGVYATNPTHAGELAAAFLRGETELRQVEVLDLDEQAFRTGRVAPRLFGVLIVPHLERHLQGVKAPGPLREPAALEAIAEDLMERMIPGWVYIIGPGSSTHAVAHHMGLEKTLLGVDAFLDGKIAAKDASEADLLALLPPGKSGEIIVTPIGGQGSIFGRGNQPISPEVIRRVGRKQIRIISTPEKIQALQGNPLWVDTGDPSVDEMLSGYLAVMTGYRESIMYKVIA